MTDKNIFRGKDEELEHLTQEMAEIRIAIKEISAAVGRIERHVKRSFGIPSKPKNNKPSSQPKIRRAKKNEEPSITPVEALSLFDKLSTKLSRTNPQLVESELKKMNLPDLKLIAHELGVVFSSKPSKKFLCSGVMGRLNERAMLSRNINFTPSQRENMEGQETKEKT